MEHVVLCFNILGILILTDGYFSEGLKPATRWLINPLSYLAEAAPIFRQTDAWLCWSPFRLEALYREADFSIAGLCGDSMVFEEISEEQLQQHAT